MELLIIVFFVLLNGVFSMSEMAVVSSRRSKWETDAKKGSKKAKHILKVVDSPDKFLSTIQIAITTIGLVTGLYTGEKYVDSLSTIFIRIGIEATVAIMISRVLIIVVETFFMLVFGELLPKRIGMNYSDKVATFMIVPMNFLSKLAWPFVWLLSVTTTGLEKLFGIKPSKKAKASEDEIKSIIDDSADAGEIDETEQDIVNRVFDLDDRRVESLMTPRAELDWVEKDENIRDIINRVDADGVHQIYPVCNNNLDDIVGVVYIKDLFPISNSIDKQVKDVMREPNFLHESVSIYDILEIFKTSKVHYAFIIDEFGMVQGMVTLNDILEALVGNSSEMDTDTKDQEFVRREDGTYLVDGQYPFYDFLSHFDLEYIYEEHPYNTISGLILALTGKVPKVGQKIDWKHFTFEIMDMDALRIDKVLVTENKVQKAYSREEG